jgi:hypothetical protein
MISNLTDRQPCWIARENDRPAGLEIRLLRQTVVLPWSQLRVILSVMATEPWPSDRHSTQGGALMAVCAG